MKKESNLATYKLSNGQTGRRHSLVKSILKFVDNERKSIKEISQEIKLTSEQTIHLVRYLVVSEKLVSEKVQRFNYYHKPSQCLLAEVFYPKSIISKFKIISRRTYKLDAH
jgi:dTDP-D-glucose 4,6-dehydratase